MTYKDRTWCFFENCKDRQGCSRVLSEEDLKKITEHNLLISQFADHPECFKEKEKEGEKWNPA